MEESQKLVDDLLEFVEQSCVKAVRHVESMLHWDSVPGRVLAMCVNQCADQLPCSKPLLSRPLMACTACHVVLNKLRSAHDLESASVWQSHGWRCSGCSHPLPFSRRVFRSATFYGHTYR